MGINRQGKRTIEMLSSTVVMDGDEYSTNDNLQQDVLNFSDKGELEIELNKLESGVCLNPKRTPTRWADRILTVSLSDSHEVFTSVVRIIGVHLVPRGRKIVVKGRKLLKEHRMLVAHMLKQNAGVGSGNADEGLDQKIEELAEGLIVVIATTLFLEITLLNPPDTRPSS
ncbi:hypothetical protein IWW34DRAFT_906083 [Fusarium oxysporum f. sp. albedinis]|nr:hypothetical protein IWW34DRAFT_906083 [Fusarium oxysporum f. sp. albedinis]